MMNFHRMERIPKKSPGIRVLVLVKFIFQKLGPDKKIQSRSPFVFKEPEMKTQKKGIRSAKNFGSDMSHWKSNHFQGIPAVGFSWTISGMQLLWAGKLKKSFR